MRRFRLNCIAVGFSLVSALFSAQGAEVTTLYVASYGGSTEKVFREKIIPAFEAKNPVKIVYVAGTSTDTVAKLQARKGQQQLNVVLLDDGPMYQAIQLGFCDKLSPAPIYSDLYPIARIGDHAVGIGVTVTGLAYNTDAFRKAKLPPPDSWLAIADPKYKQKVAVPSISNTYGLEALIMLAKLRKGGEMNIDPGFELMGRDVAPNVVAWESSSGKMTELFQTGEVTLAVWGSGRVQALKETGFPVAFVVPKEGSPATFVTACMVTQNHAPALSQAFIQYLLAPEVQSQLATASGWGPANAKAKLDPETATKVPYGAEQIGRLITINWTVVNQKRAEWTDRWNRTVER